jgi:hypothetical protein
MTSYEQARDKRMAIFWRGNIPQATFRNTVRHKRISFPFKGKKLVDHAQE